MISENYKDKLELLINGREAFERIIKRIQESKQSVHINIFIWRDDKIGNLLAKELLSAANRGVKITISKDVLGCLFERSEENKQSFFHKKVSLPIWFQQKAVDYFYSTPGEKSTVSQKQNFLVERLYNHKNIFIESSMKKDHSKFYIFDNKILITGGINIEDRAFSKDIAGVEWRDYMIECRGEVFVKELYLRLNSKKNMSKNWFEFVLNSNQTKRNFEIKQVFLNILSSVKKELIIQMAYFGDQDINKKLIELSNKGILITIIFPKKANIQNDYNYKILSLLYKKSNGKINFFACNKMLHAKMLFIDNKKVLFGSANFSKQAADKVCELNVLIENSNILQEKITKNISNIINESEKINSIKQFKYNSLRSFIESVS